MSGSLDRHLLDPGRIRGRLSATRRCHLMKAFLAAFCATVAFVSSIPASAAQPDLETRSATVGYSDLNLAGSHGVSTLEQRVNGAIHQVCVGPAFELSDKIQQRACERSARTTAAKSIQNAISSARQVPSTSSVEGLATSHVDRSFVGSSQHGSIRRTLIPRR
jgi:UrcA family protein